MGGIEFDANQLQRVQTAYDLMAEEYDILDHRSVVGQDSRPFNLLPRQNTCSRSTFLER